jgi:hypothetical protein
MFMLEAENFHCCTRLFRSRDNSIDIMTYYGLGGRGKFPMKGKIFFIYIQRADQLWGGPSLLYSALSSSVKRLGREADHSRPSSAEVKNGGAIPPLPIRLHGVVLNWLSTGTTLYFTVTKLFRPAFLFLGLGPHVSLLQTFKLTFHIM